MIKLVKMDELQNLNEKISLIVNEQEKKEYEYTKKINELIEFHKSDNEKIVPIITSNIFDHNYTSVRNRILFQRDDRCCEFHNLIYIFLDTSKTLYKQ